MNINKIIIFGLIVFFGFVPALAQKSITIVQNGVVPVSMKKAGLKRVAADSADLALQLARLENYCLGKGYLSFSIDSVAETESGYQVFVYLGDCYGNAVLKTPDSILSFTGGNAAKFVHNGVLRLVDYSEFSERVLSYNENHGFPFSEIYIRNAGFQDDTVGVVCFSPGPQVVYDSIILKGNAKLRPSFMAPYLGWKKKRRYAEKTAIQVGDRLLRLPYISLSREPGVEFVGNRAFLYVFADKQRVNQFDGYIGLVPVNANTGKVMVTGEVNLNFQNIFTIGERISLRWQSPERYSQYLSLSADFPYLFSTPFGLFGSFLLDKKDTSYLNMNYLIALQYSFAGTSNLRTYFDYSTSTVLTPNVEKLWSTDTSSMDHRKSMYGVQLNVSHVDDAAQPWQGIQVQADVAVGTRTLRPPAGMDHSLYADIDLKSTTYRLTGLLAGYVPIAKSWDWVGVLLGGAQFGGRPVYNDLFRLGGTRTLQGFDEYSIFASSYAIVQTEFRLRFAYRSYVNVFFNAAWYERRLAGSYYHDWPFGFGLGATFHTRAGNLYLSYALGQQKDSPISFKTGKIHFGIDVRF